MNDSTLLYHGIPDSLNVIVHSSSQFPYELIGLIGVALGAIISLVGNWLLAKRMAHLEIQNSLFQRKLDIYLKLTELLWPASIRHYNRHSTPETAIPKPYTSNKELSNWLNELSLFIAANRLVIDSASLSAYEILSNKIIEDLKYISKNSQPDNIDKVTQEVGVQSASAVTDLCGAVHNSGWDYFKKTYKVEL